MKTRILHLFLSSAIFSLLLLPSQVFGQKENPQFYKYKAVDFIISVPQDWWIDPFSTSSVCECEGLIAGSEDSLPKIVIYPTDAAGMKEPMRDRVWDYVWTGQNASPHRYVTKSGIQFDILEGAWEDFADGHGVLRIEAHRGSHYIRMFIFGPVAVMEASISDFEDFMERFKWR
jgi:hypothetical protein